MKITQQQALTLFDIAKSCLHDLDKEQFGGYSKKDIMTFLNQIISQQDNRKIINTDNKTDVDIINEKFWDNE